MQPLVLKLQIQQAAGNMGKTAGKKQVKPTSAQLLSGRGRPKIL